VFFGAKFWRAFGKVGQGDHFLGGSGGLGCENEGGGFFFFCFTEWDYITPFSANLSD